MSAADAYEAIAAEYDEQIRGDEWMRQALQAHYRSVFRRGERVLDLGCGTGTDALALAGHGISVCGIDGSPGMIAELHAKATTAGLEQLVTGRILQLRDLGRLRERFDGAYSSFAALSTVDLAPLASELARLVRPGGHVVVHMLNRFSLWEALGLLSHRDLLAAAALRQQRSRVFRIGGVAVEHRLYFARETYSRYFSGAFELRGSFGLGALRPPHTVRRLPPLLVATLEWADVRVGGLPGLRDAGRFFVLDLQRRPS